MSTKCLGVREASTKYLGAFLPGKVAPSGQGTGGRARCPCLASGRPVGRLTDGQALVFGGMLACLLGGFIVFRAGGARSLAGNSKAVLHGACP
jgi:hypothetical protein